LLEFVETENLFESLEHRKAVLSMVTDYAREARKKELRQLLEHSVFQEQANIEEVTEIIREFVAEKTNNNHEQQLK